MSKNSLKRHFFAAETKFSKQQRTAHTQGAGNMVRNPPPAVIDQWKKTSVPVCYEVPKRKKWHLFLNFTNRRGEKSKRKNGPGFATRELAVEHMLPFRISWEYSHRGKPWVATEGEPVPREGSAAADTALPAGKSRFRSCS